MHGIVCCLDDRTANHSYRKSSTLSVLVLGVALSLVAGCDSGDSQSRTPTPASSQTSTPLTTSEASPNAVSISPKRTAVTIGQRQQFSATISGRAGTSVSWEVDGIPGGNATVGAISADGLYSAPSVGGVHTVTARSVTDSKAAADAMLAVTDLAGVFTGHYDSQRTGQNRQEYALTPETVSAATFGKLFSCPVDGELYAQPLYVANLAIAGGTHNVVFVATQHNSVYAFDADEMPCRTYWHRSFLKAGSFLNLFPGAVTTVPIEDTDNAGRNIDPEVGITGTPVVDRSTNTLYVVAKTKERSSSFEIVYDKLASTRDRRRYVQRLHALSLIDGAEKFNGPAEISNALTAQGNGDRGDRTCPSPNGNVPFCPLRQNQRPPLLLINGKVYIAWAAHGDHGTFHGWVIGYDGADLGIAPVVFNTTPNGRFGGIWGGIAADAGGNIFMTTGNGTFDATPPRTNFGNSFIKLSTAGGTLSVDDFFTPFNHEEIDGPDWDFGSGGPLVLPDSVGSKAHPHLALSGDKSGQLYLVDRDKMGGHCDGCSSNSNIVQQIGLQGIDPPCVMCGMFTTPAVWEGHLYISAVRDSLKSYEIRDGRISATAVSASDHKIGFPGASPTVSARGATNGIVWVIDASLHGTPQGGVWIDGKPTTAWKAGKKGPAVLRAYDALNLAKELWNSSQAANNRDQAGNAVKFSVPTVANGKVYVGTQNELTVYGLLAH
jgi:hypothetical protein